MGLGQEDVVAGEDGWPLGHSILALSFENVAEILDGVDGLVNLESEGFELSDGQVGRCRCRCRGEIHKIC